jgi:hypothetical protein
MGGSLYFLTFVDDHSKFGGVYAMQSKSDVFDRFKSWLAIVENSHERKHGVLHIGAKLKVLQSDNGAEYLSRHMVQFLRARGFQHRLTAPGDPHQNGIPGRLTRTLVELVRSMLHHKNHKSLPKEFWAEELSVARHVRNRVTTRALPQNTTPYEVVYDKKPNLSYLRLFGSRCWYNMRRPNVGRLDPRACEAIMIGYARGSQGYKLWDVAESKVVVSRDVKFDELGEYETGKHPQQTPGEDVDLTADDAELVSDNDASSEEFVDAPGNVVCSSDTPEVEEAAAGDHGYVPQTAKPHGEDTGGSFRF